MLRPVLAILVAASLTTSCRSKFPLCKTDSDCTAEGSNHGAIHCIDGQCQECMSDSDCGTGKTCKSMRCVTASSVSSAPLSPPSASEGISECNLDKVHFAFDSADLTPDARAALDKVAQCLQKMGAVRVRIDGFCDERGTEEYNLALGERRATAVEKYLEALGVQRVSTISYGKEKPLCTENTEACWKRNRRAEFDVSKKQN
jgi:peptidoglycan-associated lipoprotein